MIGVYARTAWRAAIVASLAGAGSLGACSGSDVDAPVTPDAAAPVALTCEYPPGPYGVTATDVIEDAVFASGERPSDFRRCGQAGAPRLLVLRVVAASCGTCQWSAAHTSELVQDGVQLVDVLVRGAEGATPTTDDAAQWSARRDADVPTVLDPAVRFRRADAGVTLPAFVYVDPRTMTITGVLGDPDADLARRRIVLELAAASGTPIPPAQAPARIDGFARNQWEMIQAMAQPADFAPPPDPTDVHADDPRAAALGARLFEDTSLSATGKVSCRLCHDPAHAFTDGRRTAEGVASGDRNTQSLLFAAHQHWQFWDGRVDTLWAQALGPLENELEYATTRLAVVRRLADAYRTDFEAVYGPLPDLSDGARFPARGKPGQPAWDGMAAADRTAVTRAFVGVGKALAAFERTLRAEDSALDRYARGDFEALNKEQKIGLHSFFIAGCAQCHYGPRLTDDAFHVVRFPTGRRDGTADVGRSEGLRLHAGAEFGAATEWSDAKFTRPAALLGDPVLVGQFKTPSLRGVAVTAPYGHGGSEGDLAGAMAVYGDGGLNAADPRAVGETEVGMPQFDTHAQHQIEAFLEILTAVPKTR